MAELPRRRQDVSCRELEGEIVILDRAAKKVHQLNASASFIWKRCNGARTAGDVARDLEKEYGIDRAVALRDVGEAIKQLASLGLLEESGEGATAP